MEIMRFAGKDEIIFILKFIFTEVEILLEARNNELRWESMNVFKMMKIFLLAN